ncbi:GNAT family N-acetyltransferase [Mesobacillus sp. AQ2]|uniref:GNAT family N-acetyltransferase n=1 Tax=Bacillaceae TaxID=186817 RepID=UPI0011A36BA8|nr:MULTISPECIES: GNAT family N-acetyltransferase [Bacillaceae]MCM3122806.1 GNAT family N-acetyltransferase [Mesobacillus sp. MER 33]MCM3233711.1 GNAT family N-acetyltransferase [Mesobacillus sp. MER 48]WHX42766.1 GNAT family N-acetyltransferase [Mesobacillus sp. AQ2]
MLFKNSLAGIQPEMLEGFFVGWPTPPSPETHFKLLKNSSKVILAFDKESERVVGFITAISDGVLSAYIPFLEVLPEFKNRGIGKELVNRMMTELHDIYMIDLCCDDDLVPYYEKLGMIKANGMLLRNYEMQSGIIKSS